MGASSGGSGRFMEKKGLMKKTNIQEANKSAGKALGRVGKAETEACGMWAVCGVCPSLSGLRVRDTV